MAKAIHVGNLSKRFSNGVAVDGVSFVAEAGTFTTLLGPSGCGKTTTLRCIAGLEKPDAGEIAFGEQAIFSAPRRIDVPTERRGVGMMFQSYGLWPHMTVMENVAFALRLRRLPGAEIATRVRRALDQVRLSARSDAYPGQMSGGQQQRVALARALAYDPELLLLDEPLANLDAKLREEVRAELSDVQARTGLTAIYVTHDQAEAMSLSTKVIVMQSGRIADQGTPQAIYDRPRSRFVADFIGASNFIDVSATRTEHGRMVGETSIGALSARCAGGQDVSCFMIRPEDVLIMEDVSITENAEDSRNRVPAHITGRVFQGATVVLMATCAGGQLLRAHVRRDHPARPGDRVTACLPADRLVGLEH